MEPSVCRGVQVRGAGMRGSWGGGEYDVCAGVAGILCVHGCARCVCADILSVSVRGVCAGWRGHCGGPASSWPSRGPPLRGPADPRAGCCQASGRIREPPEGEAGPCLDFRKGRGCPAQTRRAAGFLSRGGHLGPLGHQLSPPIGDCSPLPASQLHLCGSESQWEPASGGAEGAPVPGPVQLGLGWGAQEGLRTHRGTEKSLQQRHGVAVVRQAAGRRAAFKKPRGSSLNHLPQARGPQVAATWDAEARCRPAPLPAPPRPGLGLDWRPQTPALEWAAEPTTRLQASGRESTWAGAAAGRGLRGAPAERAAPTLRWHTRAPCAQDSRARAVRTGARLRVTQHPRAAHVSESVTRPAAELPGGWQLRVCALPPTHPSERDPGLCSSCARSPRLTEETRTAESGEQLIHCRKRSDTARWREGAGGSGGKTPPAPRTDTSVCRVNAPSQPAQRVHVIPPGKGMLGTRPSHVPPSPTPAFCLGPGAEVHGSPKLLFFVKTCRGLPVSVAVETPDDVT